MVDRRGGPPAGRQPLPPPAPAPFRKYSSRLHSWSGGDGADVARWGVGVVDGVPDRAVGNGVLGRGRRPRYIPSTRRRRARSLLACGPQYAGEAEVVAHDGDAGAAHVADDGLQPFDLRIAAGTVERSSTSDQWPGSKFSMAYSSSPSALIAARRSRSSCVAPEGRLTVGAGRPLGYLTTSWTSARRCG